MGAPSSLSIVDPNAVERLKGAMPIERVHTWSASPIEQTGLVVALQSGDAADPFRLAPMAKRQRQRAVWPRGGREE